MESQHWADEIEEQDDECTVATTFRPRSPGPFHGAMSGYRCSRPLNVRGRRCNGGRDRSGEGAMLQLPRLWAHGWDVSTF